MTWYAFKGLNGGKAIDIAGYDEKVATAFGFHGYGTESQAEQNLNSVNPLTQWQADLLIADAKAAQKELAGPGQPNASNPAGAIAQAASSDLGLGNVDKFFSGLTSKATWIRVLEIGLGGILMAVGLVKLSETNSLAKTVVDNVPAVKAARKIVT